MFTPRGPGAGSFQHTLWPRGRVAYVFSWYKVIIALSLCFSSGALQNTVHTSIITAKMVWLNFFFELQYFGPDLRLAPTKTSQYKMQTADCRPGTKCRPQARYKIQTDSLKCFFCLIRDEIILQLTERHAIAFRDHLSRLFALLWNNPCRFLIIIVLNIISSPRIVFSLFTRVVWCDICAEFTNLATGGPKLQLWDDHLTKEQSWRNYEFVWEYLRPL